MTRQDLLNEVDTQFWRHADQEISMEQLRSHIRLAIGAFCDDLEVTVKSLRTTLDEKLPEIRTWKALNAEQEEGRFTRE